MLRRPNRFVVGAVTLGLGLGLAACGGGDDAADYEEPKGPAVADLSFSGKNFAYTPDTAEAPAGIIDIGLESTSGAHDLVIEGVPGFKLATPGSGDTDASKVDLERGEFTFYCTLPGHRAAGMEGTLTIG